MRFLLFGLVVLALLGLATGIFVARGTPPRTITMVTGPPGSSYAALGLRYRAILARSGVEVRLLQTAGDVENLAKLSDPTSGVSVGFTIAGMPDVQGRSGLESLGTVDYMPLWVFERTSPHGIRVAGLAGKRASFDLEGSGTRAMAQSIIALNGVAAQTFTEQSYAPAEGAERLLQGETDILGLVASWDSPVVRKLLAAPQVSLIGFPRADAHVALNPNLTKLVLPAGVGDLAANLPPRDVTLIAPKASLVVRGNLHTALQFLLLDAASQIHARPGIFHKAGTFPAAEAIDFPLSDEAARYYKSGRPFFQRYLPFWAAVMTERLLVFLIPVVGLLLPLSQGLNGLYRTLVNQRIFALYGRLKLIEVDFDRQGETANRSELLLRLDEVEHKANQLRVPLWFSQMHYTLKHHIGLVRNRLNN